MGLKKARTESPTRSFFTRGHAQKISISVKTKKGARTESSPALVPKHYWQVYDDTASFSR